MDEDTAPAPTGPRGQRRLEAERQWADAFARCAVDLFRLAGIYGPGRSPLEDVRAGRARRVDKPGHLFGRIHRDDIAGAVLAAMRQERGPGARVLNLADDAPAANAEVVAEAARLLGAPRRRWCRSRARCAAMSPMGRSFWAENRRVASRRRRRRSAPLALSQLPRGATRRPRAGARARVWRSRARSCGRESRWSPSLTRVIWTSSASSRSAMRSAVCQGTSGSAWPCSRRTGQASGIGRPAAGGCARPRSARRVTG